MTAVVTSVARAHPQRRRAAACVGERRLILVAFGAAAVHILDDNFVQPQPGMSPRDHLAGGLAQLALATVFGTAAGSRRVRTGAPAGFALRLRFPGALRGVRGC